MRNRYTATLLLALLAGLPGAALSAGAEHDAHHGASASPASNATLSTGEVRKVDLDAKKITIRHGPLENLGMPPMTMVFQVSDPSVLNGVKAGDKVRFLAERSGGAFTVTRLEAQ